MGLGGKRVEGSGWGTHENPWLIHVNVRQKPLQYCKVIILQLKLINLKEKRIKRNTFESVIMRQMNLELIIQSEVSQKEKDKCRILTHTYGI